MYSEQRKKINTVILLALMAISLAQSVYAADWVYTMRPGDTLWTLCKEYTKEPTCWQKLGPLNKIDRDRAIPPGTRIRVPANWLKVPAASAEIIFVQGEASLQLPGEPVIAATEGTKLSIGSTLVTADGSVSVLFADGSSMVLEPNSQLELDALSNFELNGMVDSTVRLNRGTVKTRVIKREPRSRFQTVTPSAVAAVRGTEYRVNVVSENSDRNNSDGALKTTLVEVYQGLVDVGAESEMFPVPASFGIVAKQGEPLQEPVKLLQKPEFIDFKTQQTLYFDATGKGFLPHLVQWQALALASAYQLNILTDESTHSNSEKLLKSFRTNETQFKLKDLSAGCYQLSLRAIDALGLQGLAAKKRLCLNEELLPPLLKSRPLSTDTDAQQIQLHWDASSEAQLYRVELSNSPDFSSLISSVDISETQYAINEPISDLYVRIKALGEKDNQSNYSQSLFIPAKEIIEDDDSWKILIHIGLVLLAFI